MDCDTILELAVDVPKEESVGHGLGLSSIASSHVPVFSCPVKSKSKAYPSKESELGTKGWCC
jgi:hypothetical protein